VGKNVKQYFSPVNSYISGYTVIYAGFRSIPTSMALYDRNTLPYAV